MHRPDVMAGEFDLFSSAPTLKLLGNSIILGFIEVLAEAITMGEKAGIEPESALNTIKGGIAKFLMFSDLISPPPELFPNSPYVSCSVNRVHD